MNKPAIEEIIKQKLSYAAQRGYVEPKDYDELVNLFLNEQERILKAIKTDLVTDENCAACTLNKEHLNELKEGGE